MVTNHYGEGIQPSVHPTIVIDDFGRKWVLVPDVDFFGRFDYAPAMAAVRFEQSGDVH
ncbi:hypothetical protein BLA9940_02097 [Burkholderia aenigmatica]|uniref:hypothetical protein n=1 Tax=Burkholderia aenigmatica TaxID=2015348 RepID=UPI0014534BD6|nr:hypothetical protein [Burkholderia aenigmatica]VWC53776.1 hypothetical protein BLA9940_02097 [Burkholderia aenigmatica]